MNILFKLLCCQIVVSRKQDILNVFALSMAKSILDVERRSQHDVYKYTWLAVNANSSEK